MPVVKNVSPAALILPDGFAIESGRAVPIEDAVWKQHMEHPVVKGWVEEERRLEVGGKALLGPTDVDPTLDAARHGDPTAARRVGIAPDMSEEGQAAAREETVRLDREPDSGVKAPESELLKNAAPAASTMADPQQEMYQNVGEVSGGEAKKAKEVEKRAAEETKKVTEQRPAEAAKAAQEGAKPAAEKK
jgi:hypothetical protein